MLGNLIETNARRERSAGGTLASFALHTALIALAVVATANAGPREAADETEAVEFVDTPRPDEPPPPEPEPAPPELPPGTVAAPPRPFGFETLPPALEIPDVIPEIDLSRPLTDERDFTGIGAPGLPVFVSMRTTVASTAEATQTASYPAATAWAALPTPMRCTTLLVAGAIWATRRP